MFIAILGVSGVGKTTLAKNLAAEVGGKAFCEPEREEWPSFIEDGFLTQAFDVLEWFRCYQVDLIRRSAEFGREGIAVCDAYYHKTMLHYVSDESSAWIIRQDDPYFPALELILEQDAESLPNADRVIFLSARYEDWKQMVLGRSLQGDGIILEHAFSSQTAMRDAARRHSEEYSIPLLEVEQRLGNNSDVLTRCQRFIFGENHGK